MYSRLKQLHIRVGINKRDNLTVKIIKEIILGEMD